MAFKKSHLIFGAFILFWIVFIGWGMFKTSSKLSGEKTPGAEAGKAASQQDGTGVSAAGRTEGGQEAPQPAPEQRAVLVRVFRVKAADFNDLLPVMGSVKGKTEMDLKFEINGVIKSIAFREGEKIRKGDLIASLDQKDAQLKVTYATNKFNSAQSAYSSVKKKLEVHKQLYDAGAIIKSKLEEIELEAESAKYQVETARSEMELAENELTKTSLFAIKDGVMGPRESEEGEFITAQDKVGSLFEISEVFVEVGVVERDIEKIRAGQKAKVFVDAYPSNPFEGTVKYIFPVIEGKSRTLTVKISVDNPEGLLLPGMFSRAEISIAELKDALIIPITCLITAQTGVILAPVVPKATIEKSEEDIESGLLKLRKVRVGYKTSDYAQILEGLGPEDLVVLEAQGGGELKDNTPVRIVGTEELSF